MSGGIVSSQLKKFSSMIEGIDSDILFLKRNGEFRKSDK